MIEGIKRFRQAIKNQRDLGNGDFRLAYHDAEEIVAEIEDELESLSWAEGVPAPKDADGEVVPLGTDELFTDKGETVHVERITFQGRSWHAWDSGGVYHLDKLHRTEQDSWERLEEDVKKSECEYFGHKDEPCLGCPAKKSPGCIDEFAKDVIRRAKALAERDAKASAPQPSPHEAKEANCD